MKVTKGKKFIVELSRREMNLLCSISDSVFSIHKIGTTSEIKLAKALYNGLCNVDYGTKGIDYANGGLYSKPPKTKPITETFANENQFYKPCFRDIAPLAAHARN